MIAEHAVVENSSINRSSVYAKHGPEVLVQSVGAVQLTMLYNTWLVGTDTSIQ